ncbi:HAD-IIIC family phosphatase [Niveispirillum sp. KHB5.9]|uniref:HAD-IIIC family phosphatase n=1 Tax=Niveispirillum sp. KHB5.9 TaxID=3400269 RepID=UPI003A8B26CD
MADSILNLPWLPPPPEGFRAQCRALDAGSANLGAAIQRLAGHAATGPAAAGLSKAIRRCREAGGDMRPLAPLHLAVLASGTIDLVVDSLPAAAARHGVDLRLTVGDYDQVMQLALDPASDVARAGVDAALLVIDHRWLGLDRLVLEDAGGLVQAASDRLRTVIDGLRQHAGCPVILPTIPVPALPLFGSYDLGVEGTPRAMVQALNSRLPALARETGAYLLDVAGLAERIGTDLWFDATSWYSFKLPFAGACIDLYADLLGRLLGAIRGKARKCLVLDLDNTCWGGVIGDDGLEGIAIGQGNALGEAFLAVQHYALQLRDRGVMLAVCSKNNDETARLPFREHPDMLLREEHISVFQANWTDKASNLEAIARTLNIGIDALVLLDDNPAERAQVRAALPGVGVPELPADPGTYPRLLSAAGYFEAVVFSAEDALRAASYAADARRAEVMAQSRDLGDYLSSLAMEIHCQPFDATGRQRVTQLINKSNQFNLTTRRYSEAEIAALEQDPAAYSLQVRLADRLGDMGMIGVIIARPDDVDGAPAWLLDTWLMSCRVLGRRVEEAMLAEVAGAARKAGIAHLLGLYLPTAKNGMVRDHYGKLGFALIAEGDDGCRRYRLDLDRYDLPALPFRQRHNSTLA